MNLEGKIVVVTKMRELPQCCCLCRYYDSMGGRGRNASGACTASGQYRSTERIRITKQRLDDCPLRIVGEDT